jgi:hypothetical protein
MTGLEVLRERESRLADALLPSMPEAGDTLAADEQFKTHAYLMLACALVEEHIESLFGAYVAERAAINDGRVHECFISLTARFSGDLIGQNSGRLPTAQAALPTLVGLYSTKVIKANNGVKRQNIETLAKPLGLGDRLDMCEELFTPLNTLGAKRGAVAHLGVVTEEITPVDARNFVTSVLSNLALLDKIFDDTRDGSALQPASGHP